MNFDKLLSPGKLIFIGHKQRLLF